MNQPGLPKKSALESVAGSLPTEIGTTLLAAFSGTPVAALLPILTGTLANKRHMERVERALTEISAELEKQKEALANITDAQYKLINEAILATLQATDEEKLQYLRNVLSNAIRDDHIAPQKADFLSRVIRDMSAKEAQFLVRNSHYERILILSNTVKAGVQSGNQFSDETFRANIVAEDGIAATGLISLGLLIPSEPAYENSGTHRWAAIVEQLVALLTSPQSSPRQ